jgi:hypothetical protein
MNKEIEEMARDICNACKTRHNCDKELCCMCEVVAKELVKKYRKLPKDSVVLSMEEVFEFREDQAKVKFLKKQLQDQARKETAEKILKEVGKTCGDYQWFKNLCKQFGVEIKE